LTKDPDSFALIPFVVRLSEYRLSRDANRLSDPAKWPDDGWVPQAMDNAENEELVIFDPVDNAPGIAKAAAVPGYPVNDLIKRITDFHGI
jgi:hypothetical protein